MSPMIDLEFWRELFTSLALQTVCVIAATAAICSFVQSAQWRRSLWQVGLLSMMLLTAGELTGVGRGFTEWTASHLSSAPEATVAAATSETGERVVTIITSEASVTTAPAGARPPPTTVRSTMWPAFVWLAGFALVLLRIAFARILCLRISLRNKPANADITRNVESLARFLKVKRRIRVLESPALTGPIVFGVVRPTIVLPEGFETKFETSHRQAMLAHEVAHLANRDPLWHLLADGVVALLWWNPLSWWARRQLHLASEHCADEASAVTPNGPEALAEALVQLAQRFSRQKSFGLGVNGHGFRSGLGKRVGRLLNESSCQWKPVHWRIRFGGACAAAFLIVSIALGGGFIVRADLAASEGRSLGASVRSSWNQSPTVLAFLAPKERSPRVASPNTADRLASIPTGNSEERFSPTASRQQQPDEMAWSDASHAVEITGTFVEFPDSEPALNILLNSGADWEIHALPLKLTEGLELSPFDTPFFATQMLIGTWSSDEFRRLMRESNDPSDILSAPKITTSPGLQAQIKVAQVVKGERQNETFDVGVMLDIVPFIDDDGQTIYLTLNATVRELLEPEIKNEVSSPRFRVRAATVESVRVNPGETVVLGDFTRTAENGTHAEEPKRLFILLTPKVVDQPTSAAGNSGRD